MFKNHSSRINLPCKSVILKLLRGEGASYPLFFRLSLTGSRGSHYTTSLFLLLFQSRLYFLLNIKAHSLQGRLKS